MGLPGSPCRKETSLGDRATAGREMEAAASRREMESNSKKTPSID